MFALTNKDVHHNSCLLENEKCPFSCSLAGQESLFFLVFIEADKTS